MRYDQEFLLQENPADDMNNNQASHQHISLWYGNQCI
jgi:hypothetical protein